MGLRPYALYEGSLEPKEDQKEKEEAESLKKKKKNKKKKKCEPQECSFLSKDFWCVLFLGVRAAGKSWVTGSGRHLGIARGCQRVWVPSSNWNFGENTGSHAVTEERCKTTRVREGWKRGESSVEEEGIGG